MRLSSKYPICGYVHARRRILGKMKTLSKIAKRKIEKQLREEMRSYYIDDTKYSLTYLEIEDEITIFCEFRAPNNRTVTFSGIYFDKQTLEVMEYMIELSISSDKGREKKRGSERS